LPPAKSLPGHDSPRNAGPLDGPILEIEFIRATATYPIGRGASLSVLRKIKAVLPKSNIYLLP
jgi:hypothetical protein